MSREAPLGGGLSAVTTVQPAMMLGFTQQGAIGGLSDDPTQMAVQIGRMLVGIFDQEKAVKACESALQDKQREYGEVRAALDAARRARDNHVADVEHAIDYGLSTVATVYVACETCSMPASTSGFIGALSTFAPPKALCQSCMGTGYVRRDREDASAVAAHRRISYYKSALEDTCLCAKIRAATSDAGAAYERLEEKNKFMLRKFVMSTKLEFEDAEQEVRRGLLDAVRRFDPTRANQAAFQTVAFLWCRRNSRVRSIGQIRAGGAAVSMESLAPQDSNATMYDLLASKKGLLASTDEQDTEGETDLARDVRDAISALPAQQRTLLLNDLAGLSAGQAAIRTGISRVTARRLREQAYDTLRTKLSAYVSVLHE